jgi:ligand-binding sensor domain-containing protein
MTMHRVFRLAPLIAAMHIILLALLIHPSFAHGRETPTPVTELVHRMYSAEDGLPQNSGRALIQTSDGFLWIGTQDGLVRFDGEAFHVFDKDNTPELHHNDITALLQTSDSTLWIGTYNGLTSCKNGIFRSHPTNAGREHEVIRALAEDHTGTLWIGTMNAGVHSYKSGAYAYTGTAQGLTSNATFALACDKDGSIWVGTEKGVNIIHDSHVTSYRSGNGLPHDMVRSLCVASDSTVWIGTNAGPVTWKSGSFRSSWRSGALSTAFIRAIYQDHFGTIWLGTEHDGIVQLLPDREISYGTKDGLSGDQVVAILEDHEGSMWIGTYSAGVNQFWRSKFINYTTKDGLPNDTYTTLIQSRSEEVWIGTSASGVVRFDGSSFRTFTTRDGLPHNSVRTIFEDSRGVLWIGTQNGLAEWKNGILRTYGEKDGLVNPYIRTLAEDHEGTLWVGTLSGGIHRREGNVFVNYLDRGIPAGVIRSTVVDHAGTLWIGSNEAVTAWRSGEVRTYTQNDGLPFEPIYDMLEDSDHVLWMGSYGGGLARMADGKITRITRAMGLHSDVVYQILEDNDGYLWLCSMKGLSRVRKQMLNDVVEGRVDSISSQEFSSADGMISSECRGNSQFSAYKTRDGRLWFITTKGIVVVDPSSLRPDPVPPSVLIERVAIGRVEYPVTPPLSIPSGNGQAEFHYAGLSFTGQERMMFRYRLEGFDPEWTNVGSRRTAYFTNLPPGEYIFRVTACNRDGVWNQTGASFAFTLEPRFWQTAWFRGILILTIAAIAFALYRLRLSHLIKREKELAARVDEAVARIKVLDGLIPICAHCKKIRDDKGYWDQLEGYIQSHSEATFTHGICPECAEKLYPQYFKKR